MMPAGFRLLETVGQVLGLAMVTLILVAWLVEDALATATRAVEVFLIPLAERLEELRAAWTRLVLAMRAMRDDEASSQGDAGAAGFATCDLMRDPRPMSEPERPSDPPAPSAEELASGEVAAELDLPTHSLTWL